MVWYIEVREGRFSWNRSPASSRRSTCERPTTRVSDYQSHLPVEPARAVARTSPARLATGGPSQRGRRVRGEARAQHERSWRTDIILDRELQDLAKRIYRVLSPDRVLLGVANMVVRREEHLHSRGRQLRRTSETSCSSRVLGGRGAGRVTDLDAAVWVDGLSESGHGTRKGLDDVLGLGRGHDTGDGRG